MRPARGQSMAATHGDRPDAVDEELRSSGRLHGVQRVTTASRPIRHTFADRVVASWYSPRLTLLSALLSPLSSVFGAIVVLRRAVYRIRLLPSVTVSVPVVVIGNVTVGGSGKTPLVIALARALEQRGWV